MKRLIFDAHLDLAMNAMEWNRDLRQPIDLIREREKDKTDLPDRGRGTVCFPEMQRGNIGLCVATLIARYVKPNNPLPGWHSPEQAYAQTMGQLSWYRAMEAQGWLRAIKNKADLQEHLKNLKSGETEAIGYVLSLEGADSILHPDQLDTAWEMGLRAIGPAHYGPGTYAHGTDAEGGIGERGEALLEKMESLGMILDATHLCDQSFWEAMEHFDGAVWASHSNCRALVPNHRQFSDEQIRHLFERGAVIGVAFDAWMLIPDWQRGISLPEASGVNLDTVVDHIVHLCSLAGNSEQVGIGSDLDGGFGREQCPYDVHTIADLNKLEKLLENRNFSSEDIDNILHKNWIRFLLNTWTT